MNDSIFTNGFNYFLISSVLTISVSLIINLISKIIINKFNQKYKDKITTNQYLYQTIKTIVWLVSLLVIIKQIKPLSSLGNTLLGATSIIAIAVGIAAQATFGNYIAGFFIAIHQPFKVGDIIHIKERNLSGTVKEITFRHTVLLTQEQTEIIIPNTIMNSTIVEDMSNGNYSELINLQLKSDTDLDKVQEIIDKVLNENKLIQKDKESKLIIKDISSNGYQAAFPVFTNSLKDFGLVRNEMLPILLKEFKKNKIELF